MEGKALMENIKGMNTQFALMTEEERRARQTMGDTFQQGIQQPIEENRVVRQPTYNSPKASQQYSWTYF